MPVFKDLKFDFVAYSMAIYFPEVTSKIYILAFVLLQVGSEDGLCLVT